MSPPDLSLTPSSTSLPVDMNRVVGAMDIAMLVLDSLRYDTAMRAMAAGKTPVLASLLGPGGWEERETPGSYTFAAHQAFFTGFLPSPKGNHRAPRLFALRFDGSRTTHTHTCVFDGVPDIVSGLAGRGYRTMCIGGVQFFNLRNPLGSVLPGFFQHREWREEFAESHPDSARHQVARAVEWLGATPPLQRAFLYINFSATHVPHAHHLPGAASDSVDSQAAALASVDAQLTPLVEALRRRGPCFVLVMADHGDAYGEDGRHGHRHPHPVVMTVPYGQAVLNPFGSIH